MPLLPNQSDLEDILVGKLYQRHWLGLFTAIGQSISFQEDAEDILLDVFLAALENATLPSMSDQHQEAWLRRVAYNKCMDFHRRATRRPALRLEGNTEMLHDEKHFTPERAALRQEELAQLHKHFASLSAAQQEILRLRFADELPCGPDVDRHVAAIKEYADAGFDELYINQIGPEQDAFFAAYRDEVLPRVRRRADSEAARVS